MNLNTYLQPVKTYLASHKKDISTAAPIIIFVAALIGIVVFATVKNTPNIVYQPTKACALFTPAEAKTLLGDSVIDVNAATKNEATLEDDLATSRCSYTNGSIEAETTIVAAVVVRSGINDNGVAKNKADFNKAKSIKGMEAVKAVGDGAFFNKVKGQLNILDDKKWIILSYGNGTKPEENTLEKSLELADKVQPNKS